MCELARQWSEPCHKQKHGIRVKKGRGIELLTLKDFSVIKKVNFNSNSIPSQTLSIWEKNMKPLKHNHIKGDRGSITQRKYQIGKDHQCSAKTK